MRRVKRVWQYTAGLSLRLLLRLPLRLAAGVFGGLAELFERISDALMSCDRAVKPATLLPYVRDMKQELAELDEKARHRLLKRLSGDLDE